MELVWCGRCNKQPPKPRGIRFTVWLLTHRCRPSNTEADKEGT